MLPLVERRKSRRLTTSKSTEETYHYEKIDGLNRSGACVASDGSFAGPPEPKEVVPAPAAPPPESFFRGNEFDIGAFGTYFTGTGGNPGGTRVGQRIFDDTVDNFVTNLGGNTTFNGWGGGMDFTYYTPWKYLGFRFQGAGGSVSTGNFTVSESVFNSSGQLAAFGKKIRLD